MYVWPSPSAVHLKPSQRCESAVAVQSLGSSAAPWRGAQSVSRDCPAAGAGCARTAQPTPVTSMALCVRTAVTRAEERGPCSAPHLPVKACCCPGIHHPAEDWGPPMPCPNRAISCGHSLSTTAQEPYKPQKMKRVGSCR